MNQNGSVNNISFFFFLNQINGIEEKGREVKIHFNNQAKLLATTFNSPAQFNSREIWTPM